jgi:hypothetical protein
VCNVCYQIGIEEFVEILDGLQMIWGGSENTAVQLIAVAADRADLIHEKLIFRFLLASEAEGHLMFFFFARVDRGKSSSLTHSSANDSEPDESSSPQPRCRDPESLSESADLALLYAIVTLTSTLVAEMQSLQQLQRTSTTSPGKILLPATGPNRPRLASFAV